MIQRSFLWDCKVGLWWLQAQGLHMPFKGWLGHSDSFERMPFCGCSIGSLDDFISVLGGFFRSSAMNRVWRYDPRSNDWSEVSPMMVGRAYSKTGLLNNKLYVVGGVIRGRGGLTPLKSAEVFDPKTGTWSQVPSIPFSRAQVLPAAFLADMLKPIASGMTSYKGRLLVPQSWYSWPFFVDVGGGIFDPNTNSWIEMPSGMGEGWPVRQAGTKLSVVVNEELYALDPSSSLDSGRIKLYDHQEDAWKVVFGRVPVLDFSESETPYLLAGLFGKLHVITRDANHDIAILQADLCETVAECSSSSSSLSPPSSLPSSHPSDPDTPSKCGLNMWITVATKNLGAAELVNCQVLDI